MEFHPKFTTFRANCLSTIPEAMFYPLIPEYSYQNESAKSYNFFIVKDFCKMELCFYRLTFRHKSFHPFRTAELPTKGTDLYDSGVTLG